MNDNANSAGTPQWTHQFTYPHVVERERVAADLPARPDDTGDHDRAERPEREAA
jgi:hypothetical protein